MPQMAPLNWLSLYMMFLILFSMTIILNYYSFLYQPKTQTMNKSFPKTHWKW
uniref:ATP synthase complex subunit 8 n=1 Tax=Coleoptera sp. 25 KM-2017 TaxID=2219329 RepID=A0A346RKA2_9COLE|nr:ATP synthase F0 subunit 8 [Coleoptera sp. 25 KM-2017]